MFLLAGKLRLWEFITFEKSTGLTDHVSVQVPRAYPEWAWALSRVAACVVRSRWGQYRPWSHPRLAQPPCNPQGMCLSTKQEVPFVLKNDK